MAISNEELLRKATLSTTDFGGAGQAPLSISQVDQFIELLAAPQAILPDAQTVTSSATKWQESIIDMGGRIAKPGTEGTRLSAGNQSKPTTGIVEISTTLIKAEIPVTDEVLEDNVAGARIMNSIERLIADRFGFDIEDLMLNGDTGSGDTYLALLNGWLKQAQGGGGNVVSASAIGQDYQEIMRRLIVQLPDRFKRNLEARFKFYSPQRLVEKYRDILASRGTNLGDLMLTKGGDVQYQGISLKGVPSMAITAGATDTSFIFLCDPSNLYAGYHRHMRFESFRDPREGATSFVVTARVDAKVAVLAATAVATSVDVTR